MPESSDSEDEETQASRKRRLQNEKNERIENKKAMVGLAKSILDGRAKILKKPYIATPEYTVEIDRSDLEQLDKFLGRAEENSSVITWNNQLNKAYTIDDLILSRMIQSPKYMGIVKQRSHPFFPKLCRRFSYEWDPMPTRSSNYFTDMFSKFEDLTHFAIFGTLFQWAFTDPIFRILNKIHAYDCNLFKIEYFLNDWENIKYKNNSNPACFGYFKRFCRLLFSNKINELDQEKIITPDELEFWIFGFTKNVNDDINSFNDKYESYFCFHLNLLFFIAYFAIDINAIDLFIQKFQFPRQTRRPAQTSSEIDAIVDYHVV